MRNGMYAVAFSGSAVAVPGGAAMLAGSGVADVKDGSMRGGDGGFVYIGTYKLDGSRITASIRVVKHAEGHISIFGPLTDFRLNLSGNVDGDQFTMSGNVAGQPQHAITIRGRRIEQLLT